MTMTGFFLDELEREAAASRQALEQVPEGHNNWAPHSRSMRLGYLASLVADLPQWIDLMINRDSLDIGSPDGLQFMPQPVQSSGELLQRLDRAVAIAKAALSNTSEAHLLTNWKLLVNTKVMIDQPRHVAISDTVFSHLAHHRGQLTVYIRLLNAPMDLPPTKLSAASSPLNEQDASAFPLTFYSNRSTIHNECLPEQTTTASNCCRARSTCSY